MKRLSWLYAFDLSTYQGLNGAQVWMAGLRELRILGNCTKYATPVSRAEPKSPDTNGRRIPALGYTPVLGRVGPEGRGGQAAINPCWKKSVPWQQQLRSGTR